MNTDSGFKVAPRQLSTVEYYTQMKPYLLGNKGELIKRLEYYELKLAEISNKSTKRFLKTGGKINHIAITKYKKVKRIINEIKEKLKSL